MPNLSFQECLDSTFSWFRGLATFPLLPSAQEDEDEDDEGVPDNIRETAKEKEARKSDYDVARQDVVKAKTKKFPGDLSCFLSPLRRFRSRMNSVPVSGFAEDEASPQATLHPRGGPAFSSSCPGRSGDPDSYCEALILVCHSGSYIFVRTRMRLTAAI